MELTVDITADGYWGTHWLDVAFLNQDLLDLLAENAEVTLRKNSTALDSVEPLIYVYVGCHLYMLFKFIRNYYILTIRLLYISFEV